MNAAGSELQTLPKWAEWRGAEPAYTIGIEEEVMLLEPVSWALAHRIDDVLPRVPERFKGQLSAETHGSAIELQTGIHSKIGDAVAELAEVRCALEEKLAELDLRAASSGTHPIASWNEIVVSAGERYQFVHGSMRELARREPSFALHVHIGIPDPEAAITVHNRLRAHLPLFLALSANSPFWQGRDTGLASARTPLFQAFPRVGIPRRFTGYSDYVHAVDLLIRSDAIPEPTFLWWDVRPQPRFGTIEVRIMDAQTKVEETAALAAVVQCVAKLEATEGWIGRDELYTEELLVENRFLAARDGMEAHLIDPAAERRVPARKILARLIEACAPVAEELGCSDELRSARELALRNGASNQLVEARRLQQLPLLVEALADAFTA